MTLIITLVTSHGVWASTDHRLVEHPSGKLITDASVKHAIFSCRDGVALVSYTGLGRIGRLDVSEWMRAVLRGESRTVDETLIDLRIQATERLGAPAKDSEIIHAFLVGGFLGGVPWAAEISNLRPATAFGPSGIQSSFATRAKRVDNSMLLVAGGGRDAVLPEDFELLKRVSKRKPRRPEEFMQLLANVNRRAAESRRPGAQGVSRSCFVIYMPTSGEGLKQEWYGPEDERHLAPKGMSHVLLGIDLGETTRLMMELFEDVTKGRISQDEYSRIMEEAGKRAVQPKGRRPDPRDEGR